MVSSIPNIYNQYHLLFVFHCRLTSQSSIVIKTLHRRVSAVSVILWDPLSVITEAQFPIHELLSTMRNMQHLQWAATATDDSQSVLLLRHLSAGRSTLTCTQPSELHSIRVQRAWQELCFCQLLGQWPYNCLRQCASARQAFPRRKCYITESDTCTCNCEL